MNRGDIPDRLATVAVWRCPRCDRQVRTTRRPGACPDHPFDLMEQETK